MLFFGPKEGSPKKTSAKTAETAKTVDFGRQIRVREKGDRCEVCVRVEEMGERKLNPEHSGENRQSGKADPSLRSG
jgi:hypothetical protein